MEKVSAKRYQSVLELHKDLVLYLRKNCTELLKTSVIVKDTIDRHPVAAISS